MKCKKESDSLVNPCHHCVLVFEIFSIGIRLKKALLVIQFVMRFLIFVIF